MKRTCIAILVLATFTFCACSTPPSPSSASTAATPAAAVSAMSIAEMEKSVIDIEKKSWELYKNRQAREYRALLTPGYRTVTSSGTKNTDENVKDMDVTDIKSYSLSDIKIEFPTKDTAVLTYKLNINYAFQGKDASGLYNSSAVWVNNSAEWKCALYNETKAEPQPKK